MTELRQHGGGDATDATRRAGHEHVARVRLEPVLLERHHRQHGGEPCGPHTHGTPGREALREPNQLARLHPRLLGETAPLQLAHAPAREQHGLSGLELRRCRNGDPPGKIDAGHMRIFPHQPAEAFQDQPVLVVERGVLNVDDHVAVRQRGLRQPLDFRADLAIGLVQHERLELAHLKGSRMLT